MPRYALFKDGSIVESSIGVNEATLRGFLENFKNTCQDYSVEIKEIPEVEND